jgi:hypothetical protein
MCPTMMDQIINSTINETLMPTRAEIEAQRGIVRDEQGRIIRSPKWIKERIAHLTAKEEDLQRRLKNVKAEIKYRTLELKEGKEVED